MSRFRKLSHSIWHCHFPIVWDPKYRFRILGGRVGEEVDRCIRTFCEQPKAEVTELNVPADHEHLLVMIPPKVSVSDFVGIAKGRTAIRVFNKSKELKRRPYRGNKFWAKGYCVDTVGLDEERICTYVRHQEKKDSHFEQRGLEF
jgi:REP-associated tyrosine transposase